VTSELFRTHEIDSGSTSLDTGDYFGDDASRTRPVTFSFGLKRTAATASGTMFQFGSATNRASCLILANTGLLIYAGSSGNNQVILQATNVLLAQDQLFRISISFEPNLGRVSLWVDGRMHDSAICTAETFDGPWCDDDATGLVGGSLTTSYMTPLEVFLGQAPQRRRE